MKRMSDINDDEIRVIGGDSGGSGKKRIPWWVWVVTGIVAAGIAILVVHQKSKSDKEILPSEAPINSSYIPVETDTTDIWLDNTDASLPCATIKNDTIVDSLHLQIYTPYNATPELHVGQLSAKDPDIILATMAADLRRDNGKIVGAFVLAGEPLSWGLSKKGYCAIIDGRVTLGVAENSPLFEQATEQGGYFFRQYPSVANGVMVENKPENASFRRALCNLNGKLCIIGCTDRVLMNDFSQALAHLGVSDAILLVGGTADGWYRDAEGNMSPIATSTARNAKYINYIVFRKQ